MDGKRELRVAGTDGGDHSFRQKVDKRYEKLASAKSFISTTGVITLVAGIYAVAGSFVDDHILGFDHGIVFPVCVFFAAALVYMLSLKVSTGSADIGFTALHKMLSHIMLLVVFYILFGLSYTLLVDQKFSNFVIYPSLVMYLFTALISFRSAQTDAEIIELVEAKKDRK